jgi:hypothetical protein
VLLYALMRADMGYESKRLHGRSLMFGGSSWNCAATALKREPFKRLPRAGPDVHRFHPVPALGYCATSIFPKRPSVSSCGPAVKNSVVLGPAALPLPKESDHRPSGAI